LTNGGKSESSTSSTSTLSLPRRLNDVTNDVKEKSTNHQTSKRVNSLNRKSETNQKTQNDNKSDDSDADDDDDKNRQLRHKLLPESDDFKIVFISSDSSKESELNSSLEACPEPELQIEKEASEVKNGQDMEWAGGHRVRSDFAATSR
jgi:hypothetical protein